MCVCVRLWERVSGICVYVCGRVCRVVQAVLAVALGLAGNSWIVDKRTSDWYLSLDLRPSVVSLYEQAVIPLRFLLLMSTMIPLSIQVSPRTRPTPPCSPSSPLRLVSPPLLAESRAG